MVLSNKNTEESTNEQVLENVEEKRAGVLDLLKKIKKKKYKGED